MGAKPLALSLPLDGETLRPGEEDVSDPIDDETLLDAAAEELLSATEAKDKGRIKEVLRTFLKE